MSKKKGPAVMSWEKERAREVRYCLHPGCGEMINFFRGSWRHVSQEMGHEAKTTLHVCAVCGHPVQRVRHRNRWVYRHSDGEKFYSHVAVYEGDE